MYQCFEAYWKKKWLMLPRETFIRGANSAGTRGGAVGWGTALKTGRLRVRFPMGS